MNYIKIGSDTLLYSKILKCVIRPSIMHIKYPYVLEVEYNEKHTQFIWSGYFMGRMWIPLLIPIHYETKDLKYKFISKFKRDYMYKKIIGKINIKK